MVAVCDVSCQVRKPHQLACSPCIREDGLEVAFEEGAGVLEVLLGVGFGGGDALKRFVEDADDPLLFGERGWQSNRPCLNNGLLDRWKVGLVCEIRQIMRYEEVVEEVAIDLPGLGD